MAKKAVITNVTEKDGKYIVEYASGTRRTYSKVTKTIQAWIESQKPVYNNPFFKSADAEAIFYLTQADGEARMYFLGVNHIHYRSETAAKRWRDNVMEIIAHSKHPMAAEATAEVNRIYNDMVA